MSTRTPELPPPPPPSLFLDDRSADRNSVRVLLRTLRLPSTLTSPTNRVSGERRVKIELVEAEAEAGLHHHRELWVRVLSADPLECTPQLPPEIRKQIDPDVLAGYAQNSCAWYENTWEDDDPEKSHFGFEQWWILPSIGSR